MTQEETIIKKSKEDPLTEKPKENTHHWESYKWPYQRQSSSDIYTTELKENSITEFRTSGVLPQ